jgi:hypothetical protein
MYVGIGAADASADTLPNDRFPVPSVIIACPLTPPVILTLAIAPKSEMPVTDKLVAVALPLVASSVIGPAVRPFFTLKYFTVTVPYSLLYN